MQIQKSGDDSVNFQAKEININTGLTYSDVKGIALDVFESNFLRLSSTATEIVKRRAEEITEKFLHKLKDRNPDGLKSAQDPDFQYSLYHAQVAYARSGENDLADMLVELLIDRTREENVTLKRIVLNESLGTVPKLTKDHLDILSILFVLKYTRYLGMSNMGALRSYLETHIAPFIDRLPKSNASYQHIEYAGCGFINQLIGGGIQDVFLANYPGIFCKGFPAEMFVENTSRLAVLASRPIYIPCLHDPTLFQVNSLDEEGIQKIGEMYGLDITVIDQLKNLQKKHLMSANEAKELLKSFHPCVEKLIDIWDGSLLKQTALTSVGIAIGHANMRRVTKVEADLTIWIN